MARLARLALVLAAAALLVPAGGAAAARMWVGFQDMWKRTEQRTNEQVDHISTDR